MPSRAEIFQNSYQVACLTAILDLCPILRFNAMNAKFDARSSSFRLTKDSLTHNYNLWIQTAGESGLLGLCAMLWLWGWVILRAWRSRDAGALALLAAIFVINSVDFLFFYAPVFLASWTGAAGFKRPEATPALPEGSAILTP